jgi:hypothetical protein
MNTRIGSSFRSSNLRCLLKNSSKCFNSAAGINTISNEYCSNYKGNIDEIQIEMPFGHIAGKWWGRRDIQPILCIHGWQGENF